MLLSPLVAVALLAQSIAVTGGTSAVSERTRFRFENPSTFSGPDLVPHFFVQEYDVPPIAFWAQATYGRADGSARTRVAITPRRQTRASDIDTFRLASGDTATSGTDGPVTLGGFAITQTMSIRPLGGWRLDTLLTYRRDRTEFLPDDRIVTHTQPPSITRTFITDRETTIAQVFGVGMVAERARVAGAWRSSVTLSVQPVAAARLMVRLPDKYPGVDLHFAALSFGGGASWTIERRSDHWSAGITIGGSAMHGYRSSADYRAHRIGIDVFVGTGGR